MYVQEKLPELRARLTTLLIAVHCARGYHYNGGACSREDLARFEGRIQELQRTIEILEET